jgi:hypothetical protein
MIINSAPQDQAVLSNVGQIGEFRIRNSAKAFSILSSGLYANKVRAIIRELSCNAVDSHAAANKKDVPFDVHLPNQLEPWFSIRDYGTGLSHEQVTQIYTTYFESTKTASNEFIGALGLGSKSPFSYTDNFTVTAIQNGKKGIYSAFINEQGVPSIAQMMTEDTTEPAGVEVKFSVNDRYDFDKFRQEARYVYRYFALRPVVTGSQDFKFDVVEYETENIIPGVHAAVAQHRSVAIMGNIAYPIDIPQADSTLGPLRNLLGCGLELHFAIGELDFQASREGLSYIPQTIDSIKSKLEAVNAVLADKVAVEANAIENLWERALFLNKKKDTSLWGTAVTKYITDTKNKMFKVDRNYISMVHPRVKVEDLAKEYNIIVRAFTKSKGNVAASSIKPYRQYADNNARDANGHYISWELFEFGISKAATFVFNDTKVGALERAKHHYREMHKAGQGENRTEHVYVIEAFDRTKPIKKDEFLKAIFNPPANQITVASALAQKERTQSAMGKNVTIMKLEEKGYGGYYTQKELVWRDAGKADSFDAKTTYYYLPLSGFVFQSQHGYGNSVKDLITDLAESGIRELSFGTVYGVRKGDLEFIKTQKNWINLETMIVSTLKKVTAEQITQLACSTIDRSPVRMYNMVTADDKSPWTKVATKFRGIPKVSFNQERLGRLYRRYAPTVNLDFDTVNTAIQAEVSAVEQRYPLLNSLVSTASLQAVAEYINMIDTQKGI